MTRRSTGSLLKLVYVALIIGFSALAVDYFVVSPALKRWLPYADRWYVFYTVAILVWTFMIVWLWKRVNRYVIPVGRKAGVKRR